MVMPALLLCQTVFKTNRKLSMNEEKPINFLIYSGGHFAEVLMPRIGQSWVVMCINIAGGQRMDM